jgi:hypothetical protein
MMKEQNMSSTLNLNTINYQDALRSKPVRENFTDIQNNFNLLRSEVYASIASTASEITTARGGFGALVDNINVRSVNGYGVNTGGIISQAGTPANYVLYSAGNGICPDGSGVKWLAGTSATISAVSKPRYGIGVINNDSSFAIEWGATATRPVYPDLTTSQMPLASIYQGTMSPAVFETADIVDMRGSGAIVNDRNWHFKINDAITEIGTSNSTLKIGKGTYIEDVSVPTTARIITEEIKLYNTAGSIIPIENYPALKIGTGRYLNGTPTEQQVYNALSPYIPNVNDTIKLSGGVIEITNPLSDTEPRSIFNFSYAVRTTSTRILIHYLRWSSAKGGPDWAFGQSIDTMQIDSTGGAFAGYTWNFCW